MGRSGDRQVRGGGPQSTDTLSLGGPLPGKVSEGARRPIFLGAAASFPVMAERDASLKDRVPAPSAPSSQRL
jgi:hypothetical protein